jgi:hypothetical protein
MPTSNPFPSQGSTIVVDPCIDFQQPEKCCTKCGKSFAETATYFKAFKRGGFSALCIGCNATKSAAKRARQQPKQQPATSGTRGRKRKVLGDGDPNVERKAPRLVPKEPTRWDMASQHTKEQMRSKAARERQNRYRRNNSFTPVPTHSLETDLLAFSSIPFPSRTPSPPTPPPAPREAPISETDWTNINTFHEYLSKQEMETCTRCKERWFQMDLLSVFAGFV